MNALVFDSPSSGISYLQLLELLPAEVLAVRESVGEIFRPRVAFDQKKSTNEVDKWLDDTLLALSDWRACYRPSDEYRASAESLAALLSGWPSNRRPVMAVDSFGRPSFVAKTPTFYLHLTVDEANKLTWYAESGDAEYFEHEAPFDGSSLPQGLSGFSA